jgi:hypothetical protein
MLELRTSDPRNNTNYTKEVSVTSCDFADRPFCLQNKTLPEFHIDCERLGIMLYSGHYR